MFEYQFWKVVKFVLFQMSGTLTFSYRSPGVDSHFQCKSSDNMLKLKTGEHIWVAKESYSIILSWWTLKYIFLFLTFWLTYRIRHEASFIFEIKCFILPEFLIFGWLFTSSFCLIFLAKTKQNQTKKPQTVSILPACHVSLNLQLRDGQDATYWNATTLSYPSIRSSVIIVTVHHSFPFTHVKFKSLSAGSDQNITQQAAVFEEAPAIFSRQAHNCHSETLKQRLESSRQWGGEEDELFFSILSLGVSSLYHPQWWSPESW